MSQYPNTTFPTDIPAHNKSAYSFIGVRVKGEGLNQSLQVHQFCISAEMWMGLKPEFKTPGMMGNYHQIFMIHNPTLKPTVKPPTEIEEDKPKKKRVTPPIKKKIATMLDEGASADVIAEELGISVQQVENNI